MGLGIVREKRKDAEMIAKRFRRSFKNDNIKRRVVVKPVGRATLKKITRPSVFKKEKNKKQFGVFFFEPKRS